MKSTSPTRFSSRYSSRVVTRTHWRQPRPLVRVARLSSVHAEPRRTNRRATCAAPRATPSGSAVVEQDSVGAEVVDKRHWFAGVDETTRPDPPWEELCKPSEIGTHIEHGRRRSDDPVIDLRVVGLVVTPEEDAVVLRVSCDPDSNASPSIDDALQDFGGRPPEEP
jgi:hypothetical protein